MSFNRIVTLTMTEGPDEGRNPRTGKEFAEVVARIANQLGFPMCIICEDPQTGIATVAPARRRGDILQPAITAMQTEAAKINTASAKVNNTALQWRLEMVQEEVRLISAELIKSNAREAVQNGNQASDQSDMPRTAKSSAETLLETPLGSFIAACPTQPESAPKSSPMIFNSVAEAEAAVAAAGHAIKVAEEKKRVCEAAAEEYRNTHSHEKPRNGPRRTTEEKGQLAQ